MCCKRCGIHPPDVNIRIGGIHFRFNSTGRFGQPDDIGGVVTFLCSDETRWVTAQRIEASGGMFL